MDDIGSPSLAFDVDEDAPLGLDELREYEWRHVARHVRVREVEVIDVRIWVKGDRAHVLLVGCVLQ